MPDLIHFVKNSTFEMHLDLAYFIRRTAYLLMSDLFHFVTKCTFQISVYFGYLNPKTIKMTSRTREALLVYYNRPGLSILTERKVFSLTSRHQLGDCLGASV